MFFPKAGDFPEKLVRYSGLLRLMLAQTIGDFWDWQNF
jgi:hypothetical protein